MTAAAASPIAAPMPKLRSDLEFTVVSEHGTPRPSVVVCDPVRNAYFKFEWPESAVLLAWRTQGHATQLEHGVLSMFGTSIERETIAHLTDFAGASHLIEAQDAARAGELAHLAKSREQSLALRVLHGYLFFRLPLAKPDALLRRIAPRAEWVFGARFWFSICLLALLGIYLASRQWEAFASAASATLALQALPEFAVALLCLKAIHELGHALTASRLGCRVPTMGIAVMVGAPVLYTDVSDSWRLSQRKDRLAVVFAGVAAEFIVAVAALLAWTMLADGVARDLCFALATAAVVMSLMVNLNPLMRFDGYYALSDWWRIPNLQARAFDLMLWRLREVLFDLGRSPPEELSPSQRSRVIIYGAATAIYRMFLFLGIAVVLLYVAGKAIGIILASIEIGIFIVMPIIKEIKVWWSLRSEIWSRRRSRLTAMAALAVLVIMFVPWIRTVDAPAVIVAAAEEPLHLARPGQLTRVLVQGGQRVRAGDVLFEATAPDLERDLARARGELAVLETHVARWHASAKEREVRLVLDSRLAAAAEKVSALEQRVAQLIIKAPFDGRVVDIDAGALPGQWFGSATAVARIVDHSGLRARGVLADENVSRLRSGARATFVFDEPARATVPLVLSDIRPASDGRLSEPALADRHGGTIPTGGQKGDLLARHGGIDIELVGDGPAPQQVSRGVLKIEATPTSPAMIAWRSIARVLVREQGF